MMACNALTVAARRFRDLSPYQRITHWFSRIEHGRDIQSKKQNRRGPHLPQPGPQKRRPGTPPGLDDYRRHFFAIRFVPYLLVVSVALFVDETRDQLFTILMANLTEVGIDLLFLLFLGHYIGKQFSKRIFSPEKQQIYSGFLFFRKKLADFADIDQIELSRQEIIGKMRCSYVATWLDDKVKAPIRLSPKTKSLNQLSRYYHTVAPLLQSMLPPRQERIARKSQEQEAEEIEDVTEEIDIDEVGVETVEIPIDEADGYLATHSESAPLAHSAARASAATQRYTSARRTHSGANRERPAAGTRPKKNRKDTRSKGKPIFRHKDGIYTHSQALTAILSILALIGVMGGAIWFFPIRPIWISYGIQLGVFAWGLKNMWRENIRLSIDPENRTIEFTSGFGLVKNTYDFDSLTKFTIKRQLGIRVLCMVLEDYPVDPTIVNALSDAPIRNALHEVCSIMGLDPDQWLAE